MEFLIFLITYIIIIIIQFLIIYFYIIKYKNLIKNPSVLIKYTDNQTKEKLINDEIEKSKIEKFITDKLKLRKKMFANMEIKNFIEYCKENNIENYNNMNLYYFIYELVHLPNGKDVFISRVYPSTELNNLTLDNIISETMYNLPFTSFKPDNDLIDILYSSDNGDLNKYDAGYKYYWNDPLTRQLVLKKSFGQKIISKEFNGLIGMGYNVSSVTDRYSLKYYTSTNKYILLFISIIIFISSYLIFTIDKKQNIFYILIFFLIIPNIYIIYYLNIIETFTSGKEENDRLKTINDGILSIAFLITVNLFILNNIDKSTKAYKKIFIESSLIFTISLFFLLISIYKSTSFNTINDMKSIRITKQLTFNLVIYYNLYMIINHLIYILKKYINMIL